jgi:hypothetical protein
MALDPRQVEAAVLNEVIELHPDHLTPSELVSKLSGERDEEVELRDAIRELKNSGLVQYSGDAVAPTPAALHAHALLTL